MRYHTICMVAH